MWYWPERCEQNPFDVSLRAHILEVIPGEVFGEQAGWSPREASDSDDVVGEGDHPPVRAGSLALAGFEPFGVPFVEVHVEPYRGLGRLRAPSGCGR